MEVLSMLIQQYVGWKSIIVDLLLVIFLFIYYVKNTRHFSDERFNSIMIDNYRYAIVK